MFLTFKMKESVPLTADTNNSVSPSELLQLELLALNKLKWDLASVTPHEFIEHFLAKLPIQQSRKQILRNAQTFVAVCATDINFTASPPSMIAVSSLAAALQVLYLKHLGSSFTLHNLNNFLSQVIWSNPDCLRSCQEQIKSLLESSLRQAYQHSITTETKWVEMWICLALPQTSEILISKRTTFHDESPHLCFCWVWALAKSFLLPAPHHPTNTLTNLLFSTP